MGNNNYRESAFTRSAWIGLAVFFLVFSCPVKKYIRLQLYKHIPLSETPASQQIAPKDIKDCSIADKQEQSQLMPLPLLQRLTDRTDFIPFLLLFAFSSAALLFIFKKEEEAYMVGDTSPGNPGSVPLYLRLRHLQV